jgi:hypothetical protein
MITTIILWILIGAYLGITMAHSICQDEIKQFEWEKYSDYNDLYINMTLIGIVLGPFTLIWLLQISYTWKIHWNIFKWYKK